MSPPKIPLEQRFWTKCERMPNGCWIWTAAKLRVGYGRITITHGHHDYAHRVAWSLAHGKKIPKGKVIMHTCDEKLCVNPDHLVMATQSDNLRDMWEKGRDWKSMGWSHPSKRRKQ